MSSEEPIQDIQKQDGEQQRLPTEPAAMATGNKKRPRLDLDASLGGSRERKRGKSMFGLLVGTLNKAKIEDKERNASEAAKKRQLIEQRLQNKLRKETDSVRRAEEAKKDKMTANRKEEELQLKDSIYKYRRTRLPLLSNFLVTSDKFSLDDSTSAPLSSNPLSHPPRSHPPPLYYLPKILTPEQEALLTRRKAEALEAAENEWALFRNEREAGIVDINQLRQRVASEEERRKTETKQANDDMDTDPTPVPPATKATEPPASVPEAVPDASQDKPTVDEQKEHSGEPEKKDEPTPMQADDDDAVEY